MTLSVYAFTIVSKGAVVPQGLVDLYRLSWTIAFCVWSVATVVFPVSKILVYVPEHWR